MLVLITAVKVVLVALLMFVLVGSAFGATQCQLEHRAYGIPMKVCLKAQAKNEKIQAQDKVALGIFHGHTAGCGTLVKAGAYHTMRACLKSQGRDKARATIDNEYKADLF